MYIYRLRYICFKKINHKNVENYIVFGIIYFIFQKSDMKIDKNCLGKLKYFFDKLHTIIVHC